jgi:polyhydroxybutyrate depolymerase
MAFRLVAAAALAMTVGLAAPPGSVAAPAPAPEKGRIEIRLSAGEHERAVRLFVPAAYDAGRAWPLVLFFHGAGGSGDRALDDNGWAEAAEREGFLVAAPDGLPARPRRPAHFLLNPRLWNDGQLRAGTPRTEVDDVAFVRAMIDELSRRFRVDPDRVFAAGHSNGAGMVFRLGAEMADRLTAIAPVAGHCWIASPRPAKPLPTLYIVGTADPLVRLEGGEMTTPWGKKTNPPVRKTLETWAAALGVTGPPRTISEAGGLRREIYGDRNAPGFLETILVAGQGHGWPGGRETLLPDRIVGPRLATLDATAAIWEFFRTAAAKPGHRSG